MEEKIECVAKLMRDRLELLAEHRWLSTIDVYTVHEFHPWLDSILNTIPSARSIGVNWYYSRPPVKDIEFEMDMRGVVRELVIDLS